MSASPVTQATDVLPTVSASIYCHGCVDELLRDAILPFWTNVKNILPHSYLWIVRYDRGGQHLKIRLHAPEPAHAAAAKHLEEVVEAFFAGLPAKTEIKRDAATHLPPIDVEDQAGELRPDRSLIWTKYHYSPEMIGAEPLSSTPGFEAAWVHCRAVSTAATFEWLEKLEDIPIPSKKRLAFALQLVAAAAHGIHLHLAVRARYLAFQRDWLLRVSPDRDRALATLDSKISARPEQLTALRPLIVAPFSPDAALGLWSRAVSDLVRYCLDQVGHEDLCSLEGNCEELVYFAISRVVHNALNPVAVGVSNEAYICHLLRSAFLQVQASGGAA